MRPHVIWNTAMSLDGVIGIQSERLRFSNDEDKKRTHELRASVDAVMVGINTVIADNPSLTVKYAEGENPIRVVVDSKARIPLNSKVLDESAKTIVAVTKKAPIERIEKLKKKGADVIVAGNETVNLKLLLQELYKIGVKRVLHEGGGTLNSSMLSEKLIDEAYITIAPILVGEGVNLVTSRFERYGKLRLLGIRQLGNQAVLHYEIV